MQALLKKNMRDDSCLHFRPGVSNPDQGKCVTLELYFTFKLPAGKDAVFQSSHFWPYVTSINMWSYLSTIDLSGSVSSLTIFH